MKEVENEDRFILLQGLDALIAEKEYKIEEILERTEDDYKSNKHRAESRGKIFSLENMIQKDVEKVQKEIQKIEEVKKNVNNGKNRLLFVPNYIQLCLTEK